MFMAQNIIHPNHLRCTKCAYEHWLSHLSSAADWNDYSYVSGNEL